MNAAERSQRPREWSIQEVARLAGTTSRTLRHYDDIGLLPPSRVGFNGYRYYDADALLRLQRILLLRQLGLGLPAVREVLASTGAGPMAQAQVLRQHLEVLRSEQRRLGRQIASVQTTITTLEGGGELMADTMFDGFDHARHKDEVIERWGPEAWKRGDDWWKELTVEERGALTAEVEDLNAAWIAAAEDGETPHAERAQALAARHVEWLSTVPGVPGSNGRPDGEYLTGLAEMYVADERFAANYGGRQGAELVRDALHEWVRRNLPSAQS